MFLTLDHSDIFQIFSTAFSGFFQICLIMVFYPCLGELNFEISTGELTSRHKVCMSGRVQCLNNNNNNNNEYL